MRKILWGILFLSTMCLLPKAPLEGSKAEQSRGGYESFINTFIIEEKDGLAGRGITPTPYVPPKPPPAPLYKTGLLPLILVNHSTLPDSEVFILITAKNYATPTNQQVWGVIDLTQGANYGNVTLQPVEVGDNSTTFSYPLSSLPITTGGRVIYIPPDTQSGIVWFSMENELTMTVAAGSPPSIVQPNFTNPSDPNYLINYDIFEFTFDNNNTVFADATAVSFFSIPLYGFLNGATSQSSTTGLYQARSYIMEKAQGTFNSTAVGAAKTQWSGLFERANGQILRLLSTGKGIAASLFDANYLDDSAAYGYSYINNVWTGTGAYYLDNPLLMSVTVTSPSTTSYNYTGQVNPTTKAFVFTSTNGGPLVTFLPPTTSPVPTGTTTFNIFSALNLTDPSSPPTAGTAADAVSKLFEEAVVAGLLPLPVGQTLSLGYLAANQASFYTIDPNLSPTGQATGPWYDDYSKALHALGSIYTYGFDEPLWPQVLLEAPFVNDSTYLSITIGSIQ